MSESEDTAPSRKSNTRKPANTNNEDPDPATLPTVATRVNAPAFTIPTVTANGIGPSAAAIQREVNRDFIEERKTLAEVLASVEGGKTGIARYTLQLHRLEPRIWRNRAIRGYLPPEYPASSPPTNDDIAAQHGGGTYQWRIMTPNPKGGAQLMGPTTVPFEISGDPIPPPPVISQAQEQQHGASQPFVEMAKIAMDAANKQADAAERRAEKFLEQNKSEGGGQMSALLQMQQKQSEQFERTMLAQQQARDADFKALQLRLESQERERKAEREAAERLAKEERAAAEAKAERELKEREARWEKERADADRRHQENLLAQQKAIEQARLDADKRAQEARDAAEARRLADDRNFQLQIEAMKSSSKEQIQMMQTMQTMQLQNFKELDGMKMSFFEKQLSQKPQDPLDVIEKAKRISDIISGKDDEEKEPVWKEILAEVKDGIREAGPSLMTMAGITNNAVDGARKRKGDGQERRQLKDGKRRRRVKPDTTVVVDLDEEDNLPEDNEETHGLKELKFPEADEINPEVLGDLLVRDLEFALDKDNDATWIVNNVIKRFPPIVASMLKNQPTEKVIAEIKKRAPPTWKVVGPAGIKVLKEAHSILQKG